MHQYEMWWGKSRKAASKHKNNIKVFLPTHKCLEYSLDIEVINNKKWSCCENDPNSV
jgi:hypothetical protein